MFDKSVDVISLLFPEICICLYFLYSKCYIKGKTGMGVKLSTMKKYLIVFKHYCKTHNKLISMFSYTEQKLQLLGISTFRNIL